LFIIDLKARLRYCARDFIHDRLKVLPPLRPRYLSPRPTLRVATLRSLSPAISIAFSFRVVTSTSRTPTLRSLSPAISFALSFRVISLTPELPSCDNFRIHSPRRPFDSRELIIFLHRLQLRLPTFLHHALQQRPQRCQPCAPFPRHLPHESPSTFAFTRVRRPPQHWHLHIRRPTRPRAFHPPDPARPELL